MSIFWKSIGDVISDVNHPGKGERLPEKYEEYAKLVDGMQIRKNSQKIPASTDISSPSEANKRSKDIFGKPVADQIKTITDFLDGKYDGVIEGIVKIRMSALCEHLEDKKQLTKKANP